MLPTLTLSDVYGLRLFIRVLRSGLFNTVDEGVLHNRFQGYALALAYEAAARVVVNTTEYARLFQRVYTEAVLEEDVILVLKD